MAPRDEAVLLGEVAVPVASALAAFEAVLPGAQSDFAPAELQPDVLVEQTRPFFAAPYLSFFDLVLVDPRSYDTYYSLNNITFSD